MKDADHELAAALRSRMRRLVFLQRRLGSDLPLTTVQGSVLAAVAERPRRMSDLAEEQGVRLPTMTVQVARLEERGLVSRTRDATDARVVAVAITAAGRTQLQHAEDQRNALLGARITMLSEDERSAIANALPALDQLLAHEGDAAGAEPPEQASPPRNPRAE